jgi:hypothetical protein
MDMRSTMVVTGSGVVKVALRARSGSSAVAPAAPAAARAARRENREVVIGRSPFA